MKIFIAGSISIKELSDEVKTRLDNIINKKFEILVGDASGIDSKVQEYLITKNYKDVTIYTSMKRARNNKGKWKVNSVDPKGKTGREKHTVKDEKMSEDADFGLMIWDGKSQGTLNNVINLINKNKKVSLYYGDEFKITSENELGLFINERSNEIQKLYLQTLEKNKKRKENKNPVNSQIPLPNSSRNNKISYKENITPKKEENENKIKLFKEIFPDFFDENESFNLKLFKKMIVDSKIKIIED